MNPIPQCLIHFVCKNMRTSSICYFYPIFIIKIQLITENIGKIKRSLYKKPSLRILIHTIKFKCWLTHNPIARLNFNPPFTTIQNIILQNHRKTILYLYSNFTIFYFIIEYFTLPSILNNHSNFPSLRYNIILKSCHKRPIQNNPLITFRKTTIFYRYCTTLFL